MYCAKCGANISELDRVCPNCSSPVRQAHSIRMSAEIPPISGPAEMGRVDAPQPLKAKPDKNVSRAAVAGMALGIVAAILAFLFIVVWMLAHDGELAATVRAVGGLCGIISLAASCVGHNQCVKDKKEGKTFAIVGIVCSLIGLAPLSF